NLPEPAAVPEALVTSRVLDDPIEGDVGRDDNFSHFGSPLVGIVSYDWCRHRKIGNWALTDRPVRASAGVYMRMEVLQRTGRR
ncbi:MAG TPA: hypothetical protein VIX84_02690, partial [Acidimicrobiales bacterium]